MDTATAPKTAPQYETKRGALSQTYQLFNPLTVQTGAEISFDRIEDHSLAQQWFYTANVPLIKKQGSDLLYGMGGNVAFHAVFGGNTQERCDELIQTGFVRLSKRQREEIDQLERSGEVVFVRAFDLQLKGDNDQYRFIPIRTGKYEKDMTVARVPFVGAGYGHGDHLRQVMAFLNDNPVGNIKETKVYVVAPDYVAEHVEDGQMLARASRLFNFDYYSNFNAVSRVVDCTSFSLRGVLVSKSAEGGPEKTEIEDLEGKIRDAGRGIGIAHKEDFSPEAWDILTRKQ